MQGLMKVFLLDTLRIEMDFRCYNKNTKRIVDCIDVKVDEHIKSKVHQPINNSFNDLVKKDEKDDNPLLD